jgi:hypothetical protein
MSSHAHNHKAFKEQTNRKQTHILFLKNIADTITAATTPARGAFSERREHCFNAHTSSLCPPTSR